MEPSVSGVARFPGTTAKAFHLLDQREQIPPVEHESTSVLPAMLIQLSQRYDDCICRFHGADISGGAILHKVARLSAILRAQGINADSRVGVALHRAPDQLVVILALWQCGACYVPVDLSYPRERLQAMAESARLTDLLLHPDFAAQLRVLPLSQLTLDSINYTQALSAAAGRGDNNSNAIDSLDADSINLVHPATDHPAYILYTSGSSGFPKAVAITHGNLSTLFAGILRVLHLPARFRLLACARMSFDISLFELLAPILAKGTMVMASDEACQDPHQLPDLIQEQAVTVVQATPSLWRLLNLHLGAAPLQLSHAIATGEPLRKALARDLLVHTRQLWNLYGPTECTLWASAHQVQSDDLSPEAPDWITIGKALPGYSLTLGSTRASPGPDAPCHSEIGELLIEGPAVAPGYLHTPAPSASGFIPPQPPDTSWRYQTGDHCQLDANGNFHFLGRLDAQRKFNGRRIDLNEINRYLNQHPSITDACCLIRQDRHGADQLVAFMIWQAGQANKNARQLKQFLARWLPPWMVPERYYPLGHWPLNNNGKLDQTALLKLTIAATATGDDLQAQVSAIFCEVLQCEPLAPGDNFFDMGGNSMLAATLVMTLNETMKVQLSLREVLSTPPTVRSITSLLEPLLKRSVSLPQ